MEYSLKSCPWFVHASTSKVDSEDSEANKDDARLDISAGGARFIGSRWGSFALSAALQ